MYSNCFTYYTLATGLNALLQGKKMLCCFSSGKDDLFLQFGTGEVSDVQVHLRFLNGEVFILNSSDPQNPGRNALFWYEKCWNQKIKAISHVNFEREIRFQFENGEILVLQGFGRFANFFMSSGGMVEDPFRKSKSQPQPVAAVEITADYLKEKYTKDLTFLTHEMKADLANAGFDSSDAEQKLILFNEFTERMKTAAFFIDSSTDPPVLGKYKSANTTQNGFGLEILNSYAKDYLRRFIFKQQQTSLISSIQRDISHYKRISQDMMARIESIKGRRSYKELGDLIMTNAHSIKKGVTEPYIIDYYTGNPIRIKLNPLLSAAENAERLYKKAKNEFKEIRMAEQNLHSAEHKLAVLNQRLSAAAAAMTLKELPLAEKADTGVQTKSKSYKIEEIMDFTIWVGKNAKSNDDLLKDAGKSDMWFHARGVAGSHVLIRSNGKTIPEQVIEKAAEIAAQNSKAKTQSVVPVIYTERKFVIKPKGAAPGKVRVMKEQVLDVFL